MNTTPPDGGGGTGAQENPYPGEQPGDQATATRVDDGPRVSTEEMKDLARLRRTEGPERRIAGVAAGLARHLDVDPLLLRVAFVVTALFGGAGLFLYVGLWLVVPDDRGRVAITTQARTRNLVVIALLVIAGLAVLGAPFGSGDLWPVTILLGVIALVLLMTQRDADRPRYGDPAAPGDVSGETAPDLSGYPGYRPPATPAAYSRPLPPPDPRKRGPLLFWPTVATIVLAWGVLGMIDVLGASVPFAAYPGLALALVGAGLLLGSTWGRAGGLIALGLALLVPLSIGTATAEIDSAPTRITPVSGTELPAQYSWGAGDHVLDLRGLSADELDGSLQIDAGMGRIRVLLPADVNVEADASVGLGEVNLFGTTRSGPDSRVQGSQTGDGDERLDLEIHLGLGDVRVIQENQGAGR